MTITNHILAGALIGLVISNPIAAIAGAFISHFVMDALPHFGYAGKRGYGEALKYKLSYVVALVALLTSLTVVLLLALSGKWFAILTGLIAASPDAIGLYNWLAYEKHGKKADSIIELFHVKFHRRIQWCERPWGVIVEILVFVGLLLLSISLLPIRYT